MRSTQLPESPLIRLIGIDVDGTLVGSGGAVHPRVWQAAQRACAAGIHLALCSGRPAFGVALEYARRLDSSGWHIFQNGASILDLAAAQSRSVALPADAVDGFIAQARESGDVLELYSDTAYVSESRSDWAREHAVLLGVPFEVRSFESLDAPVVRAQWLFGATEAQRFAAASHPGLEVALSTSPLMSDTTFVGITRAGVTKGSAVTSVAEVYGIDLRDVMYVGDADNDLSALQIVGHPLAMANAAASVLKVAERTVGHVDEGGLADALELAIASR
jgi:Cof subfamily protein (haloacid dehalogenase superfamily)